jgi:hypothetical protein
MSELRRRLAISRHTFVAHFCYAFALPMGAWVYTASGWTGVLAASGIVLAVILARLALFTR